MYHSPASAISALACTSFRFEWTDSLYHQTVLWISLCGSEACDSFSIAFSCMKPLW